MRRIAVFLLLTGFLGGASAQAYVPPSAFIVKNVASKHQGYKGLRLRSTVSAVEDGKSTAVHFKEIALVDGASRTLRSRAYDDAGKLLYAADIRFSNASTSVVNSVLFEPNSQTLTEALRAAGIPIKTEAELLQLSDETQRRASEETSLSRWKQRPAWVIGRAGDRKQLWVEKDSFLPVRLLLESAGNAQEFQFESHRFVKEFAYPRLIHFDGLIAELNDLSVNPDMSEMKTPLVPGFTDAGKSADSGLRNLIQRYYQGVR